MHIISPDARLSPLADLEISVRGSRLIVAEDVRIDAFVKIKFVGGLGDVSIGARSYINSGVVIYSGHGVTIGQDVLIAANCTFAPVSHEYHNRHRRIVEQGFRPGKGGITLEDDVWVGANCVLLDGSYLAQGVVIAAHSLVRGRLEPYGIYGGNPLKLIRFRGETSV